MSIENSGCFQHWKLIEFIMRKPARLKHSITGEARLATVQVFIGRGYRKRKRETRTECRNEEREWKAKLSSKTPYVRNLRLITARVRTASGNGMRGWKAGTQNWNGSHLIY